MLSGLIQQVFLACLESNRQLLRSTKIQNYPSSNFTQFYCLTLVNVVTETSCDEQSKIKMISTLYLNYTIVGFFMFCKRKGKMASVITIIIKYEISIQRYIFYLLKL